MAENGVNTGSEVNLGDLGQIRNILMGQQMSAYESRFKELEELVATQANQISERINELEKNAQRAMEAMEKNSGSNLDRLEKMVEKKLDQLNKRLDDTSVKDKAKIGKMLADMGKKLMDV